MTLLEPIKHVFTAENKAVYQCDACSETFKTDPEESSATCPSCGSTEVTLINRV